MRAELGSGLELATLVGVAVVQPVLGPFGQSPETFVGVGAGRSDIVWFALIVAFLPFAGVWALAAVSRVFGPAVRSWAQTALVALLAGLGAVALGPTEGSAVATSAIGLLVGAASMVIHRRWLPGRLFLRYASPLPVVLVLLFLLASPTAGLLQTTPVPEPAPLRGSQPPVVFVVLDELPTLSLLDGQGGIDASLFPNLARVADTSTWYRNHTSVASATLTALPAMLTGRIAPDASDRRAATSAGYPDNLITLLAETHEVHGREWATQLCPQALCPPSTGDIDPELLEQLSTSLAERPAALPTLLGEARDLWSTQVGIGTSGLGDTDLEPDGVTIAGMRSADDRTRLVLEFISGIEQETGDRPTFDYLHAPFPHTPWTALPSGRTYDGPEVSFGAEFLSNLPPGSTGEELGKAARARHLLQLQWTDRLLGTMIDRLEAAGRWDEAAVVITADHGVSFEPGHMRIVAPATQVDLAWAPLFIKEPGQRSPDVVDDSVSSLDVLPTVADLADIDLPWDHDGASLVDGPGTPDRPQPMSVEDPAAYENRLDGDLVDLDADGLAQIKTAPSTGAPDDTLRVWRNGRHGALIGRQVSDVGLCSGNGPEFEVDPSPRWSAYVRGDLAPDEPLPLWRQLTLDDDEDHDVAAVVDGTVVAWSVSVRILGVDGNRVGLLLTEPLVRSAAGEPEYYEIVDEPGCKLRPMRPSIS